MSTTHTPGPWILQTEDNGRFVHVTDSATEGVRIAMQRTTEEGYANARLIAAAPELLAMLEAIRTAYDNAASHGHAIPSELVRAIGESAAITAKAKGWATA